MSSNLEHRLSLHDIYFSHLNNLCVIVMQVFIGMKNDRFIVRLPLLGITFFVLFLWSSDFHKLWVV